MSDQRDGNNPNNNSDNNDNRSPEEIQRDIEATQDKLAEDLDELSYRASPERFKDQATEGLEGVTDAASDATEKAAREVILRAEAVGERVTQRLRENPLPVVLVGATLAAGWLLLRSREDKRTTHTSTTYASAQRVRPAGVYTPETESSAGGPFGERQAPTTQAPRMTSDGGVMGTVEAREATTAGPAHPASDTPTRDTSQTVSYDFDADSAYYQDHYEETFADSDQDYEHYERAYHFGAALPDYPDYHEREWEATHEDAKRDWERTNDAPWDEVREAVRIGWERARRYR